MEHNANIDKREIELKFGIINSNDIDIDILKSKLKAFGKVSNEQTNELHNIYYDNKDKILSSRKIGLRIRKANDFMEQTLKAKILNLGGLHDRIELNCALDSNLNEVKPNLALFDSKDLAPFNLDASINDFEAIAYIPFRRQSFDFEYRGSKFNICIDESLKDKYISDLRVVPFKEFEIELVSLRANKDVLQAFIELMRIIKDLKLPLTLSPFSKLHNYMLRTSMPQNLLLPNFVVEHNIEERLTTSLKLFEDSFGLFLIRLDKLSIVNVKTALEYLLLQMQLYISLFSLPSYALKVGIEEALELANYVNTGLKILHKRCSKIIKIMDKNNYYNLLELKNKHHLSLQWVIQEYGIYDLNLSLRQMTAITNKYGQNV